VPNRWRLGTRRGRINEAAGVDDDKIGAVMFAGDFVAFSAQARDDALGINQSLRASRLTKLTRGRQRT
jgi:hypothetical protein